MTAPFLTLSLTEQRARIGETLRSLSSRDEQAAYFSVLIEQAGGTLQILPGDALGAAPSFEAQVLGVTGTGTTLAEAADMWAKAALRMARAMQEAA